MPRFRGMVHRVLILQWAPKTVCSWDPQSLSSQHPHLCLATPSAVWLAPGMWRSLPGSFCLSPWPLTPLGKRWPLTLDRPRGAGSLLLSCWDWETWEPSLRAIDEAVLLRADFLGWYWLYCLPAVWLWTSDLTFLWFTEDHQRHRVLTGLWWGLNGLSNRQCLGLQCLVSSEFQIRGGGILFLFIVNGGKLCLLIKCGD